MCHSSKPQADVASSVRTSAAGGASACTSCEKVRIARHEFLAATNLWPPHRTQSGKKYVSTWPQNCSHVGGMTVTPDQNLRAIRAHMSPQDYDWWLRIVDFRLGKYPRISEKKVWLQCRYTLHVSASGVG